MDIMNDPSRGKKPRYTTRKYSRTSPLQMFSVGSTVTNAANEPIYRKSFVRDGASIAIGFFDKDVITITPKKS